MFNFHPHQNVRTRLGRSLEKLGGATRLEDVISTPNVKATYFLHLNIYDHAIPLIKFCSNSCSNDTFTNIDPTLNRLMNAEMSRSDQVPSNHNTTD